MSILDKLHYIYYALFGIVSLNFSSNSRISNHEHPNNF